MLDNENPGAGAQDAAGETPAQNVIDWTKVSAADIPADLIKQTPLFTQVKDEAIHRRQQLKLEREQKETPEPAAQPIDIEKLRAEIAASVRDDILSNLSKAETTKLERNTAINGLITEMKLPDEARTILDTAKSVADMKVLAEKLALMTKRFDTIPGGNGQPQVQPETVMQGVYTKLGWDNKPNGS